VARGSISGRGLGLVAGGIVESAQRVFAAVAAAGFYLLLVRWLPGEATVRRLAALLATAFFVANPTVRSQALQAEVYTLHAALLIAILWAAQNVTVTRHCF
jgi:multisubunit Na+/H+ antiporter MnhF subunit